MISNHTFVSFFSHFKRFQHGLQMRQRDSAVKFLGEGFQVHVRGVHVIVDIVKGFARDVAVGDHHRAQPGFLRGVANIDHVLAPNRRLVVGEGDGRATVLNRQQDTSSGGT